MKFKQYFSILITVGTLSACYVVPIGSGANIMQTPASGTTVGAGETVLNARLYPSNAAAQRIGTGQASVIITQSGHGTFRASIGGEPYSGDATRNANSRSGKANGASAGGRYVSCDYTMNSDTVGTGTCRLSTGETFAMHIAR